MKSFDVEGDPSQDELTAKCFRALHMIQEKKLQNLFTSWPNTRPFNTDEEDKNN